MKKCLIYCGKKRGKKFDNKQGRFQAESPFVRTFLTVDTFDTKNSKTVPFVAIWNKEFVKSI